MLGVAVMRISHSLIGMDLDWLRTFLEIARVGSINTASQYLKMSQSTVTRRIQSLETTIGAKLLDRTSKGVSLTPAGQMLYDKGSPLVSQIEDCIQKVKELSDGKRDILRIGYMISASNIFLNPVLSQLRKVFPDLKIELKDMSPGEQISALRSRSIDVALIGQAGELLESEFYVKRIKALKPIVMMSVDHPLAEFETCRIEDLKGQTFISANVHDMPGHDQWVQKICRAAKYKPRFGPKPDGIQQVISEIISSNAIYVVPDYIAETPIPGIHYLRLENTNLTWDFYLAWQVGKTPEVVRKLIDYLSEAAESME